MRTLLIFLALCCPAFAQTAKELRHDVTALAADDMGGRMPSSAGMLKAQAYVVEQLRATGFHPTAQKVETPYGICYNIVLTIPGVSLEQGIVVGAHLDHVGTDRRGRIVNGADDNASGSAALIGLAKRLKDSQPRKCITFVWFTSEETGDFEGSTAYATALRRKPSVMINLDMIGHLATNTEEARDYKTSLDKVLAPLFKQFPFAQKITYEECPEARGSCQPNSDQYPFCSRGVPSVLIHTGLHSRYHTYADDADTLDYVGMEKVCEYVYQLILVVAGSERKLY